jgi:hypothetical protein
VGGISFLAACGGAAQQQPASTQSAVIRPITQAQTNLAHYKSADGVYGLVLDRTGPKPKVQIDGQKDVIELTTREDRVTRSGQGPSGSLLGYLLLSPDGTKMIYIGVDGDIHYLHDKDDLVMNSDRAADPLPAATITGTAPDPTVKKSTAELLAESLGAISVRSKMPQYTSDDAADLTKVAAVIAQLDAPAFVHFATSSGHSGKFAPVPKNPQDAYMGEDAKKKAGMGKYNATLVPILELSDDATALKVTGLQISRRPQAPADNTPGIIWEAADREATFVTLDGGRFIIDLSGEGGSPLVPGVGPVAQWPAPLAQSALGPAAVASFVDLGVLPQKMKDDQNALQDAWHKCAQAAFPALKPQLDATSQANLTYGTKEARIKAAIEKWQAGTTTRCKSNLTKMETLVVAATESRNKDRLALLEKAKARVAALNLAH